VEAALFAVDVVGMNEALFRRCVRYTGRLAGAGIESSVGSVGESYDNAWMPFEPAGSHAG
jgi:hypothetical protein